MLPRHSRGFVMKLSKRLTVLLEMLPHAERVADIGCDHGKLSLALLKTGSRVWGVDISASCLRKAELLIAHSPFRHNFTAVEGDGFSALEGICLDAAVVAGLSGQKIGEILREYRGAPIFLALQPVKGCPALRRTLDELSFSILDEVCTEESGHTYFSILARAKRVNRPAVWPDPDYSETLLQRKDAAYRNWLLTRRAASVRTANKLAGQNTPAACLALEKLRRRQATEEKMLALWEENSEG